VQTPTTDRSGTRRGVVWQVLADALSSVASGGVGRVLDCGGGSGTYAVPLADLGAEVTVVDISADALATLERRADEAGVGERVRAVQGDVEALPDAIGDARYDLVLAHGVLEEIDDVSAAFAAIAATVRPGGLLSILVGNPVAAVLGRALAGDPAAALAELRALDGFGRLGVDGVRELCRQAGLVLESRHGVGVFSEIVPGTALDAPGGREALDQLEAESSVRAPFVDIASRVHLLARRPNG
jgi:SAM-dependent methyltransferase